MTFAGRLPWAFGASLLVNAAVWALVGSAVAFRAASTAPPIEIQRVILTKEGKKIVKVVKPQEVKKKVERIVRERRPAVAPLSRSVVPKAPSPQGAHHKVLTAAAPVGSGPKSFAVLPGGNAAVGKPTEAQAPGTAAVNPPDPPKTEPPPPPADPPKAAPPVPDPLPKVEAPKADPAPKVEPVKKKGPTREAQHSNEVNPSFPDELKTQEFKSFVRVRVEVRADGGFEVVLRTSSGNAEVDRRVLEALKKWSWKPALHEGEAVDSTVLFRFEFEIK